MSQLLSQLLRATVGTWVRAGAAITACAALALPLSACADGGGSGGGKGAGGAGQTSSAVSEDHWQVALAALGTSASPLPLQCDQAAADTWNAALARGWPVLAGQLVNPQIEAALRQQLQAVGGNSNVSVQRLRDLTINTSAPPALRVTPGGTTQDLTLELPAAPGRWSVGFTADVQVDMSTQLFGSTLQGVYALDLRVEANDVQVVGGMTLDVSAPPVVRIASSSPPGASLSLQLSSSSPLLNQLSGILNQVLAPAIRAAVLVGGPVAQQQLQTIMGQLPSQPFGAGNTPAAAVSGQVPLRAIAEEISDTIQRDHMPWGNVLSTRYDAPGVGNGVPVGYFDHGDSVGWTNIYVLGEAIRHDLTGAAAALAGVRRGLAVTLDCLEVATPAGGLLSRCVVPVSDPLVSEISGEGDYFTGYTRGVQMGSLGDMSRDHYIRSLAGAVQAYLRIPGVRSEAHEIVTRMLDYLDGTGWLVYRVRSSTLSRAFTFAQAPSGLWAFVRGAYVMDPPRYQALHDRNADMARFIWLPVCATAATRPPTRCSARRSATTTTPGSTASTARAYPPRRRAWGCRCGTRWSAGRRAAAARGPRTSPRTRRCRPSSTAHRSCPRPGAWRPRWCPSRSARPRTSSGSGAPSRCSSSAAPRRTSSRASTSRSPTGRRAPTAWWTERPTGHRLPADKWRAPASQSAAQRPRRRRPA
jgi:hypothetical protein